MSASGIREYLAYSMTFVNQRLTNRDIQSAGCAVSWINELEGTFQINYADEGMLLEYAHEVTKNPYATISDLRAQMKDIFKELCGEKLLVSYFNSKQKSTENVGKYQLTDLGLEMKNLASDLAVEESIQQKRRKIIVDPTRDFIISLTDINDQSLWIDPGLRVTLPPYNASLPTEFLTTELWEIIKYHSPFWNPPFGKLSMNFAMFFKSQSEPSFCSLTLPIENENILKGFCIRTSISDPLRENFMEFLIPNDFQSYVKQYCKSKDAQKLHQTIEQCLACFDVGQLIFYWVPYCLVDVAAEVSELLYPFCYKLFCECSIPQHSTLLPATNVFCRNKLTVEGNTNRSFHGNNKPKNLIDDQRPFEVFDLCEAILIFARAWANKGSPNATSHLDDVYKVYIGLGSTKSASSDQLPVRFVLTNPFLRDLFVKNKLVDTCGSTLYSQSELAGSLIEQFGVMNCN